MCVHEAQEGFDVRPALRIQVEADGFGVMAQDEAEEFAEGGVAWARNHLKIR